jgi:hypothetical protein
MRCNGGKSTYSSTGSTKRHFGALTCLYPHETLGHREKMKNIIKLLTIAGLTFAFATCASADVTWFLQDVTFSDGATATGFFTTDPAFDALDNWSVNVSGSSIGANYDYLTTNSNFFDISPTFVALGSSPFVQFILVIPQSAMTNAGGTINLLTGDSGLDCNNGPCGTLLTGSITSTSPTPEPRFGAILLVSLAGLGFLARRKFAAARS